MSAHHDRWRNGEGQRQRTRIAATLPQPCCRCGHPVTTTMKWEADHVIPLLHWPTTQPYPDNLIRPAHRSCNRAAGGRDGARITNTARRNRTNQTQGLREW